MTKDELKDAFDAALDNFVEETKNLDDCSKSPLTEGQAKELVKQVYYVLNDFKKSLLKYLD